MKRLLTGFSVAVLAASVAMAAPINVPKAPRAIDHFITDETDGQLGYLPVHAGPRVQADSATSRVDADQQWRDAARVFTKNRGELLGAVGSEEFEGRGVERDQLGMVHVRLQETLAGLRVVGGDIIVHADAATGAVRGINGRFLPDANLPRIARLGADEALERGMAHSGINGWQVIDSPELTYVLNEEGGAFLAWASRIQYVDDDGIQVDRVFTDAVIGTVVSRHPEIFRAKSRKTYTSNNGSSLPGTLLFSEGGSSTDTTAQAAYNYAGNVYDYYKNVFGRDSYNGAGAVIISSVHYQSRYNNAFWNGSQMVYGDGDGTNFSPLAKALDVDAHELTHAVTERTSNLTYTNESGALNEASSDILGNSCEAYSTNGGTPNANTWKVGEAIYTPNTAGDALRYMNNPTQDGSSKDYYPSRYTGSADNGGVHSNSGIANLAYYLMVMGGKHPRGVTTNTVPALSTTSKTSLDMGQRIWYRALTTYFTSSTNFAAARTATMKAATDLYGATANTAVDQAWQAVGVGTGGTQPPPSCTAYTGSLTSGGSAIVPGGTYYQTTATGIQSGKLTGPSGADFDLYLYKYNGSSWTQVASSTGSTATENISYNGTAGYYYYKVLSYSGSGSYSLCISHP